VGLIVRDVRASLDFYRMLGLDIPPGAGSGGYHRMQLSNGQTFFWDSYEITRGYDPDWEPSSGDRRIMLEFGFSSARAVDDKYAELIGANYEGRMSPRYVGEARYAMVKDPDGNEISLRHPATD
jgi:catechol 2,3-dioxygenase-like lactoylglutathione lyase family enzyme